jgi:hypothetical protein
MPALHLDYRPQSQKMPPLHGGYPRLKIRRKSVNKSLRLACLAFVTAGLVSVAATPPAYAFFHHHHKKHVRHVKHKKHKTSAMVRDAQISLINLGYYKGHPDGLMGPKTVKAIRVFQRDHGLKVTGKLTRETYNAIIKADKTRAMASLPMPVMMPPPIDTLPAQPGLVGPTNQQYADPLLGGPTVAGGGAQAVRTQELSSRYGKLDINENVNGNERRYTMTLNGRPILDSDHQPSIIGISQTFKLENEDAIVISTYRASDPVCAYQHYLLTLAEGRNEIRAFGNCTHGYQARAVENSLFVTFPEVDDQRVAGATWRYESGDLERL